MVPRIPTPETPDSSDLSSHHYRFREEGMPEDEDEVMQELRDSVEHVNMY